MRVAAQIALSDADQAALVRMLVPGRADPATVLRARIVLLAASGETNKEIARKLGIGRITVARWRDRFATQGIEALGIPRDHRLASPRKSAIIRSG